MKRTLFAVFLAAFLSFSAQAGTYFVSNTGNDANTGTSWATSFATLQKALETAIAGDFIWIAKGKYIPTGNGTGKNVTFKLKNGIRIYGGFAGTELLLTDRNAALIHTTNSTILTGDVNGDDNANDATLTVNKTDNAYRVISNVTADAITATAVLDGVTVTGGHAISGTTTGAGIYIQLGSPTLNNIRVVGNIASNGGGLYVTGTTGSSPVLCTPIITNAVFSKNIANTTAGGVYLISNASPTFTNVVIDNNKASGAGTANGAGGVYIINSTMGVYPTFINATISNNTCGNKGGGVYIWGSSPVFKNVNFINNTGVLGGGVFVTPNGTNVPYSYPTFTNAVFTGNNGTKGGGIYVETNTQAFVTNATFSNNTADLGAGVYDSTNTGFNSKIRNTIIWGNTGSAVRKAMPGSPVVSYSLIEGSGGSGASWNASFGTDSIGNIASNPLFQTGTYTLQATSPAVNTGNDDLYTATGGNLLTDTCNNGLLRKNLASIDMGAYERQDAVTPVTLLSFTAQKTKENHVLAEWKVVAENTGYYEVQRSIDGFYFTKLSSITAEYKSSYAYADNSPFIGTNYYRLKIIDKDGSIAYSKTISINLTQKGSISAYPTPARNTVTVNNTDANANGKTAVVVDLNGRVVYQFILAAQNRIDVGNWATGIYLLKTVDGGVLKLVVQ